MAQFTENQLSDGSRRQGVTARFRQLVERLPGRAVAGAGPPRADEIAVTLKPLVSGLAKPVVIVDPHDGSGRRFVAEQGGLIRAVRDGRVLDPPYLDLRGRIGHAYERGVLGLVFHPEFRSNGHFFVAYTDRTGDVHIARFTASEDADSVSPATERSLFVIPHAEFTNANGGHMVFGPDGCLYIGVGDGGGEGDPHDHAQDRASLQGKILRVDVNTTAASGYTIPADNPYDADSGFAREIWAYGLRHPWRFSFDRVTGRMWIADIGEHLREEINTLEPGAGGHNFGWPCWEGTLDVSAQYGGGYCQGLHCEGHAPDPPLFEYAHVHGRCAVVGGFVYRGARHAGVLAGRYLFGDFGSGELWVLEPAEEGGYTTVEVARHRGGNIASFGEDDDGELYAVDHTRGMIFAVTAHRRPAGAVQDGGAGHAASGEGAAIPTRPAGS
jgi:glucose/arabinose dehydrogenase